MHQLSKKIYLAVIPDKLYTMSRKYPGRTEVTSFYTHFLFTKMPNFQKKNIDQKIKIQQNNKNTW